MVLIIYSKWSWHLLSHFATFNIKYQYVSKIFKCTKYGKDLRLGSLQESSLNWGDVERTCLQAKSQSIRNTSKPQFLLKVINKSTTISHDLYFSWPKKWHQNIQNLRGTGHRWVVSMQICEHFDVVSMIDERTGHEKLLFSSVITLTVFYVHFRWSFLENRTRYKEKNKLRHHHITSIVCTLIKHSSWPISAREIILI